jgi:hypothetical protein
VFIKAARTIWDALRNPEWTDRYGYRGRPLRAAYVGGTVPTAGGGWSFVLSDLKTLLETGKSLES